MIGGKNMSDLIDRQAAIENSFEVYTKEYGWCEVVGVDAISELPSAQPEIIRCKDCKWCKDADGLMCMNTAS